MFEVSAAIITNGKEVLCFRKGFSKHDYLSCKFEFPGGKIEPNESPQEALVRELSEELVLHCQSSQLQPFHTLMHEYADFSVRIHYFFLYSENPNYVLKEHTEAKWCSTDTIGTLDWADADREAVTKLEAEGLE